jgi:hypothetical protein
MNKSYNYDKKSLSEANVIKNLIEALDFVETYLSRPKSRTKKRSKYICIAREAVFTEAILMLIYDAISFKEDSYYLAQWTSNIIFKSIFDMLSKEILDQYYKLHFDVKDENITIEYYRKPDDFMLKIINSFVYEHRVEEIVDNIVKNYYQEDWNEAVHQERQELLKTPIIWDIE